MRLRNDRSSLATSPTLLKKLQEQEQDAWVRLVKIYSPILASRCFSKGLNSSETQDVLQETWVSVGKTIGRFDSTPGQGSFRSWLHRILMRRIADQFRNRSSIPTISGGYSVVGSLEARQRSDSSDTNSNSTGMKQVGSPLSNLSTELQKNLALVQQNVDKQTWDIFLRSMSEGTSTESIAAEFSVTPANVRQIRSRILRRIRSMDVNS